LDFGIAKLIDDCRDETLTVERLLTPSYASPEQLRGEVQTTATDVYSLGAVLHNLLTGRSPHESADELSNKRLSADLPHDIECILRKALRSEPSDRYPSVDAFADDIRAFLDSKPVQARSGDVWYRIRKFLRRNRLAVAAASIAIAGLLAGLLIANHQRAIAEKRFSLVRQLAKRVLALDQTIGGLDISSKARQEIAAMSKEYLSALGAEAHSDENLALEVGDAYTLLARVQGISFNASSAQHTQARESLGGADSFVQPILRANPDNRKALLVAATISHHRMIIASANYRRDETLAHARESASYLNRLLALGNLSREESASGSQLFNDISLAHKNTGRHIDAIEHARRSIEFARSMPDQHLQVGKSLSMLANLQRLTADLEGALDTIREARTYLAKASFPSETARRSAWALVISREAKILGAPSGLGLGRPDEAAALFQRAFDMIEEWTQYDLEDTWSRMLFGTLGWELGELVRPRDPRRALNVYDHSLMRLREVKNSAEARRGEAEVLSGSSYALRQLGRPAESKARIDAAFRLLKATGDYPRDRVIPNEAANVALRALGDHLADTGQTQRAQDTYEELLRKITAFSPQPQNDLTHAIALSHIYAALTTLSRSNGDANRSQEFAGARIQLWRHWDSKLANNDLIRRQLQAARGY
jgi:serine/threonine-protein kinase